MPLDSTRAASAVEQIETAVAAIRLTGGRNAEPADVEYFVASVVQRCAERRRDKATRAAVAAGVLPDHTKAPLSVGVHPGIYRGDLVEIGVTVVEQPSRLDADGFVAALIAGGVKPALVKRLRAAHTTDYNPAHRFAASLVTG